MKVYVAFLGRGRYPYHPLINLITDTVDIGNAQIDLALWSHQLFKRNHFLLLQHGCLFCTVLLVFSLREEGHQELVTTQDSITEHVGEEARKIGGPLCHILLFVILVTFVRLCGRHYHVWISLNEIVLQQVKIFILSAHFTSNVRDLHLE